MNRIEGLAAAALMVALTCGGVSVQAQSTARRGDQRTQQLMSRLETHADQFSKSIDRTLDRSRLNWTEREDNINALVDEFEFETDQLRKRYADNEAVAADVETVLSRGLRLDVVMQRAPVNEQAKRDWAAVREDLSELARTFNVVWVWDLTGNNYMKNIPVKQVFRRIEERTDEFANSLDLALDRGTLDGSKAEDEINSLVHNLEEEADQLSQRVANRPGGGIVASDVEALLKRAMRVEEFMQKNSQQINPRAKRDWARVKANFDELAQAYNVTWVWTIKVAPTTSSSGR